VVPAIFLSPRNQIRPPTTLTLVTVSCNFFFSATSDKLTVHYQIIPFTAPRHTPHIHLTLPSPPFILNYACGTVVCYSFISVTSHSRPHTVTEIALSRTTVPLAAILEPPLCSPYDVIRIFTIHHKFEWNYTKDRTKIYRIINTNTACSFS
jgi:hypothetical protein